MKSDQIVLVDRTIQPVYPDWMKQVLHPELELTGPSQFDVAKMGRWLHDCQRTGISSTGDRIYQYLKKREALQYCLNLADLVAIQAKGIDFYCQHFGERIIVDGWKSEIKGNSDGIKGVFHPYLKILGKWLLLDWGLLDTWFGREQPVFFFTSKESKRIFKES